jgi:hypothetical protein
MLRSLCMENFLICENSKCRFVVDLREGGSVLSRSQIVLNECPECGQPWSTVCPFCSQALDVGLLGGLPHCSHCHRKLHAETV